MYYRNHKDEMCKATYNPEQAKTMYPNVSFMCAEQTFSWLSRYRRILCAMPKTHHLFFLHRLVKRRNKYTELCRKLEREPLLPHSVDIKPHN